MRCPVCGRQKFERFYHGQGDLLAPPACRFTWNGFERICDRCWAWCRWYQLKMTKKHAHDDAFYIRNIWWYADSRYDADFPWMGDLKPDEDFI
jgi:hypothetical protein